MNRSTTQILIATHGDLACALARAVEQIAGPQPDLICLELLPGGDVEAYKARMEEALSRAGDALILVDMRGGSPWNVAMRLVAQHPRARVVSGVNLPMLLEVALSRAGMDVDRAAALAQETGLSAVQRWG